MVVPKNIMWQWVAQINSLVVGNLVATLDTKLLDTAKAADIAAHRWIVVAKSMLISTARGNTAVHGEASSRVLSFILDHLAPATVIFDEVHEARNDTTHTFKACRAIAEAGRLAHGNAFMCVGMTGTPIVNVVADLCNIVRVVNAGAPAPTDARVGCPESAKSYDHLTVGQRKLLLAREVVMVDKSDAGLPPVLEYRIAVRGSLATIDAYYGKVKALSKAVREAARDPEVRAKMMDNELTNLQYWAISESLGRPRPVARQTAQFDDAMQAAIDAAGGNENAVNPATIRARINAEWRAEKYEDALAEETLTAKTEACVSLLDTLLRNRPWAEAVADASRYDVSLFCQDEEDDDDGVINLVDDDEDEAEAAPRSRNVRVNGAIVEPSSVAAYPVPAFNKVLVFAQNTLILQFVARKLASRMGQETGFPMLTGDTKESDKEALIRRFMTAERTQIIFMQSGAAGVGLDLYAATSVVFLQALWTPAMERQCIDRAHRRGQRHVVRSFNVYLAHSLDESILDKTHVKKRAIAHTVMAASEAAFEKAMRGDGDGDDTTTKLNTTSRVLKALLRLWSVLKKDALLAEGASDEAVRSRRERKKKVREADEAYALLLQEFRESRLALLERRMALAARHRGGDATIGPAMRALFTDIKAAYAREREQYALLKPTLPYSNPDANSYTKDGVTIPSFKTIVARRNFIPFGDVVQAMGGL